MKRQWRIRRDLLATPDGHQRWDRAYQHLLHWTAARPASRVPSASDQQRVEVEDEDSDLRAGIDAAPGTGTDH